MKHQNSKSHCPGRRLMLRAVGLGLAGLVASSACSILSPQQSTAAAPSATATPFSPTAAPTSTQSPLALPSETLLPSATPLPATPTALPRSAVSMGQAASYEVKLLRAQLETMLDALGGIGDIARPGAHAAIKVNLTGGTMWQNAGDPPATEVFVTHPGVVAALCELLLDAGVKKISIVEGVYEWASYSLWGYEDLVDRYGVNLVDLNEKTPYAGFAQVAVKGSPQLYETFTFNPVLDEVDLFVSVAKMKCHYSAGVTHTLKNLVGLAPLGHYRREAGHNYRSGLHGGFQDGIDQMLIRGILDLNQARPIHLCVVDGVMTCDGGEGPWQKTTRLSPGVLIASKDPVAADAVATAVMGFNPEAGDRQLPFVRSENYLTLARELGLGTNRLAEIPLLGAQIADVQMPFAPSN